MPAKTGYWGYKSVTGYPEKGGRKGAYTRSFFSPEELEPALLKSYLHDAPLIDSFK